MRSNDDAIEDDVRFLVDLAVSQLRTRQILSRTRDSIATTREALRAFDGLALREAPEPLTEGPLASPGEPA